MLHSGTDHLPAGQIMPPAGRTGQTGGSGGQGPPGPSATRCPSATWD